MRLLSLLLVVLLAPLACSTAGGDLAEIPDSGPITGYIIDAGPSDCADGEFLELSTGLCHPLDTEFGFDQDDFDAHVGTLELDLDDSECNEVALREALAELQDGGGGRLTLPACEIALTSPIYLSDSSVLEGAGIGETTLYIGASWTTAAIAVRVHVPNDNSSGRSHVILRDLTVRGDPDLSVTNVGVLQSDNVLIERVDATDSGRTGINFSHSRRVTVRYCKSSGAAVYHGVGSKDCFAVESMDGDDSDSLVSKDECAGGDADYYTEDFAVYSNELHDNAGMGLDTHASYGEAAGNMMLDNVWASKFPEPAHHVWIHHNVFEGADEWGTKITNQYDFTDETLTPHSMVLYQNSFLDNGAYGVRIGRAHEIYLIGNVYSGNGHDNKLRIVPDYHDVPSIYSCPGDQIGADGVDGSEDHLIELEGDDPRCDLTAVSVIFD